MGHGLLLSVFSFSPERIPHDRPLPKFRLSTSAAFLLLQKRLYTSQQSQTQGAESKYILPFIISFIVLTASVYNIVTIRPIIREEAILEALKVGVRNGDYTSFTTSQDFSEEDSYITGRIIPISRGSVHIIWDESYFSWNEFGDEIRIYQSKVKIPFLWPYYKHGPILNTFRRIDLIDEGLYYNLPNTLRARTPEEVGTVVWLESEETSTSESKYRCTVIVIDRAKNIVTGRRVFQGGASAFYDIYSYITTLPRRNP